MAKNPLALPLKTDMKQFLYCTAKCKIACARKQIKSDDCIKSDLSIYCSNYIEEKENEQNN